MEYTEGQKAKIRTQFVARRRRQILVSFPLIALVVGAVFLEKGKHGAWFGMPPSILFSGVIVLIAGAVVFSLFNWRCPACNRYLGKQRNPKFCSRCGVELR